MHVLAVHVLAVHVLAVHDLAAKHSLGAEDAASGAGINRAGQYGAAAADGLTVGAGIDAAGDTAAVFADEARRAFERAAPTRAAAAVVVGADLGALVGGAPARARFAGEEATGRTGVG